jgi:hypothetical protein
MRTLLLIAALALTLGPAAGAQTLADLRWLKGCWRSQGAGPEVTEVWIAPPAPVMLGYSYTIGEGEVQGWERARIEMIDGWPHFVAMPGGAPAVRFRQVEPDSLVQLDDLPDHIAWFSNPDHDYPQHVVYTRTGNMLRAFISRENGADRISFEYRRIRCPADLRP